MRINEIDDGEENQRPEIKDDWQPGERAHFEYHCLDSHDSSDAELWYRSQQPVTVLGISEAGNGSTFEERLDAGEPRVYSVKFKDGHVGDVWEDELLTDASFFDDEFCPPPQNEIDRGRAMRGNDR